MNILVKLSPKKGAGFVRPIEGELLRFHVLRDEESDEGYLVDLQALDGNGECGCPHFQFRLKPQLASVGKYGLTARCKHIRRARSYFLDEIIRTLSAKLGKEKDE